MEPNADENKNTLGRPANFSGKGVVTNGGIVGRWSFALCGHMTTKRYANKGKDPEFLSPLQL